MEDLIKRLYAEYNDNPIKWMQENNCVTTKQITEKLMALAVDRATEKISTELKEANMVIANLKNELQSIAEDKAGADL